MSGQSTVMHSIVYHVGSYGHPLFYETAFTKIQWQQCYTIPYDLLCYFRCALCVSCHFDNVYVSHQMVLEASHAEIQNSRNKRQLVLSSYICRNRFFYCTLTIYHQGPAAVMNDSHGAVHTTAFLYWQNMGLTLIRSSAYQILSQTIHLYMKRTAPH